MDILTWPRTSKGFDSTFSRIIERVIHTRKRTSNDQQMVVRLGVHTCSGNCALSRSIYHATGGIVSSLAMNGSPGHSRRSMFARFFQLASWFVLSHVAQCDFESQVAPSFHFWLLVLSNDVLLAAGKERWRQP